VNVGQTVALTIVNGAIYGLLALGVVLIYRGSRVLNFALGEIATGAVFVALELVHAGVPYVLAALIAVSLAVTVGVLFERLVISQLADAPRVTAAVATIGLFLLILTIELTIYAGALPHLDPLIHGSGVEIFGYFINPSQMLAIGVVVLLAGGLTALLRRTDFGLAVLASADDAQAVRLVGVPLWRVSAFTWGAGSGLAAIAGLLLVPSYGGTNIPGEVSGRVFLFALAAALIGGLSSLQGAFLGGMVVALLDAVSRQIDLGSVNGLSTDVVVAVIIAVLILRPQGLLARTAR
jgi:branched-chain amino acid transport system permease protein